MDQATQATRQILDKRIFGKAGAEILIEEFLEGEETSIHALTDGQDFLLLPSSQDHKRAYDGDLGPNTGGMGAYAPAPAATPDLLARIGSDIFKPLLAQMRHRGIRYRGVLYGGLMLTPDGPKVLEFNCRFGDPETQVLMPLLQTPLLDLILAVLECRIGSAKLQTKIGSAVTVVLAAQGYPNKPVLGTAITGLRNERETDCAVFHAGTSKQNGNIVVSGGRVLSATGWGEDFEKARQKAYRLADSLRFDGVHFRTDIGHRRMSLG
jgi:phosphoribosylamine--glycine ligase